MAGESFQPGMTISDDVFYVIVAAGCGVGDVEFDNGGRSAPMMVASVAHRSAVGFASRKRCYEPSTNE
jgi:hypothetical protein